MPCWVPGPAVRQQTQGTSQQTGCRVVQPGHTSHQSGSLHAVHTARLHTVKGANKVCTPQLLLCCCGGVGMTSVAQHLHMPAVTLEATRSPPTACDAAHTVPGHLACHLQPHLPLPPLPLPAAGAPLCPSNTVRHPVLPWLFLLQVWPGCCWYDAAAVAAGWLLLLVDMLLPVQYQGSPQTAAEHNLQGHLHLKMTGPCARHSNARTHFCCCEP